MYVCPRSVSLVTNSVISGMWSVARGTASGDSIPSVAMSSWKASICGAVKLSRSFPAFDASWMMRSSTSVRFMTSFTRHPL